LKKVKVLGCGNILAFDEGVGIHIVRQLRREILPERVEIEELKSPGKILPELITGSDKLIIIDACRGEDVHGGFAERYRWGDGELKNIFSRTIHAVHLSPLFELNETNFSRKLPQEIVIFGIKIGEKKKFGVGLSKEVFASLDDAINAVLQELY